MLSTGFVGCAQFSEQMTPQNLQNIILIYLAVINVVTFFMYGIDKWKAKKSKWRIRETALLGLAVLGGSIGAWLGMKVWHHKTQHKKFKYGVPAPVFRASLSQKFNYPKNQQLAGRKVGDLGVLC